MFDYTLDSYDSFCNFFKEEGYSFLTVEDLLSIEKLPDKFVCMRHDVDRMPKNALEMARREATLGVKSTYYFRAKRFIFDEQIVKEIQNLGHEVGYHYEVLSDAKGSFEKAKKLFVENLHMFRQVCNVSTVCMHGAPISRFDNLDFWKKYSFEEFNIVGEPYLSLDFQTKEILYFTDTGRSWGDKGQNLRDHAGSPIDKTGIDSTNDLIRYLKSEKVSRVMIQTHPERWAYSVIRFLFSIFWDFTTNLIKMILKYIR